MNELTLPTNLDNLEHEHVDREHLFALIAQTEEWAAQIRLQFQEGKAHQLKKLFQYNLEKEKTYFQKQLLASYFLNEETQETKIKGIYVLGSRKEDMVQPIYVGISRNILLRLKNHGWGKTNYQSTLLKKIFQSESETNREQKLKRIQDCYVYIIPITSDYDMYIQEVMLAGLLKTEWNTFRTH